MVIPKKNSQCICLSIILLESVIALGKHYHPQVFLEKYNYVIKEKNYYPQVFLEKTCKNMLDDIETSLDSDYQENSDEETLKKIQTAKILMKKILTKKIKYKNFSGFLFTEA